MTALSIFNISSGADTGGTGIRLKHAFAKYAPDWNYRCMVRTVHYMAYPVDLPHRKRLVEQLWPEADVIHLRNNFYAYDQFAKKLGPKPTVCHYHGTSLRSDPVRHIKELHAHGGIGLVSTLDLWLLSPQDFTWCPSPYDIDWLQGIRHKYAPDSGSDIRPIVIAHAPTERQIKSTAKFLDAFQRLQDEGWPVELELIEHRPWTECLERKAKADIFFDQTILGYGNNALEAWGMGIPVIAGAADETLDEMERRFGHLPFYHATEDTIYDALKELVESPELRDEYGQRGFDYVRRWHSEEAVVELLKGVYLQAAGQGMEEAA